MTSRRTIGKLAKEAGVGVETIRFYERKGLIDQPRAAAGYRRYGDETLAAIRYIKAGQRMGLSLAEIAELRDRLRDGPAFCKAARETARRRLEKIEREIAELRLLQTELTAFLSRCSRHPADRPCQILTELAKTDAIAQPALPVSQAGGKR